MSKEFVLVVDESGGGSSPQNNENGDFGVGAMLIDEPMYDKLDAVSRQIEQTVGSRDYKYRHVAKNDDARLMFLDVINQLTKPLGIFGLYAMGGGLLNERNRTSVAMTKFGDDATKLLESIDAIKRGDTAEHLKVFLTYFVPCIMRCAGSLRKQGFLSAPLRVLWDQRSDLERIVSFCNAEREKHRFDPDFGDISRIVEFEGSARGKANSVAKLAGVLAGDIRASFKGASVAISESLANNPLDVNEDLYRQVVAGKLPFKVFFETMLVQDFSLPLGGSNPPAPMLDLYRQSFFDSAMSLISQEGSPCHIVFQRNGTWKLYRFPD